MNSERLSELNDHPERATPGELVYAALFCAVLLAMLATFIILAIMAI